MKWLKDLFGKSDESEALSDAPGVVAKDPSPAPRGSAGPVLVDVSEFFTIPTMGLAMRGVAVLGELNEGDTLELVSRLGTSRVTILSHLPAPSGVQVPPNGVAVLVSGVTHEQVREMSIGNREPGFVLATPGHVQLASLFEAEITLEPEGRRKQIKNGY